MPYNVHNFYSTINKKTLRSQEGAEETNEFLVVVLFGCESLSSLSQGSIFISTDRSTRSSINGHRRSMQVVEILMKKVTGHQHFTANAKIT